MNENMIRALIFLSGFGVGAIITGLCAKIYFDARLESEYHSMKDYYDRKILLLTKEEDADAELDAQIESMKTSLKTPRDYLRETAMHTSDPDLNAHVAEREFPDDDEPEFEPEFTDEDFDEYDELVTPYTGSSEDNFTILGEMEYYGNPKNYDQETVYFYDEDDVLLREDESIISDIENTVGYDSLTRFDEDANQPDIVYVRNNYRKTEYEIIRMHQSYSRNVLGIKED